MFKWCCLALAAVAVAALLWLVNDVRTELKRSTTTVNDTLPEILTKTKKTADTLADLSEDVKQLRELAGIARAPHDPTLATYADSILDLIESSGGRIGLEKKLLGSGLKDVLPAAEWVASARKEALAQLLRVHSRAELLKRLGENKFGSPWYIEFDDTAAVPLIDWIRQNHPESQSVAPDSSSSSS